MYTIEPTSANIRFPKRTRKAGCIATADDAIQTSKMLQESYDIAHQHNEKNEPIIQNELLADTVIME